VTGSTQRKEAEPRPASALFGRGMLYVAVWAIPLVSSSLVSPVLTHVLPPAQFGQLSTAIALFQVFLVLAVAGLDQALVLARARAASDLPARSIVTVGLVLAAGVTLLAVSTTPVWSGVLGFTDGPALVALVVAWILPAGAVGLSSTLLLSQDRLAAFAVVVVGSGVGGQVVGLALLIGSHSRQAGTYALGYLGVFLVAAVVGLALVRPRWRGLLDGPLIRRAFLLGVPLMFGSLASFVLNAGDRVVVQGLLNPEQAGRYQIAYIVGEAAVSVLGMTGAAWAPHVAAVRDPGARGVLLARARDGLIDLLTPAVLGVTLGAPLILRIVAPTSYKPSELLGVVFLVVVSGFPLLIASTFSRGLVVLERVRVIAAAAAVAALANIGLNLLLVPLWRLEGAAVATLISYTLQAVVLRVALARHPRWPAPTVRRVLVALVVVAASAGTILLPDTPAWVTGRFVAAVACLPWFFLRLRLLRSAN
jgi:O-antigen/teichoic acid export membrane protein